MERSLSLIASHSPQRLRSNPVTLLSQLAGTCPGEPPFSVWRCHACPQSVPDLRLEHGPHLQNNYYRGSQYNVQSWRGRSAFSVRTAGDGSACEQGGSYHWCGAGNWASCDPSHASARSNTIRESTSEMIARW